MLKKVVSFVLCFVMVFSLVVFGEDEEDFFLDRENTRSSLEELSGKRLYVYGLIDSLSEDKIDLDINTPLNRLDATKLIYRLMIVEELGNNEIEVCPFTDVPTEYMEYVTYLFNKGIISGTSKTTFGAFDCSLKSFCYMLLKYKGVDCQYDEAVNKAKELNFLKYVTIEDNILTKGDAYLILSNILTDKLENKREEILIPKEIDIYVTSYSDFLEKFEIAYYFAPQTIYINYLKSCSDEDKLQIYDVLIKDYYSHKGVFDDFYNINRTDTNIYRNGLNVSFFDEYHMFWRQVGDSILMHDTDLFKDIYENLENGVYTEKYGDYSNVYADYLRMLKLYEVYARKDIIKVKQNYYEDFVFLNLDSLDWIKCYNDKDFTESIIECLSEIEKYRELPDYKKINKVHDYICRNATYDYNESRSMHNDDYDYRYADAHSVEGFLRDGRIVCDGYAYTFQWLMDYLGVECITVYGDSTIRPKVERHAWNKVKLDEKWYNIDVCWADTGEGYKYFLKSDDYYLSHNHITDNRYLKPNLQSSENYK